MVTTKLENTTLLKEVCWRQKLRALWLREVDKNTKIFHQIANPNRYCNIVEKLVINGVPPISLIKKKMVFLQFVRY